MSGPTLQCRSCETQNPDCAQFCAQCGKSLGRRIPVARRKCCPSSLAILGFVGFVLVTGLVLNSADSKSRQRIQADLPLSGAKADAVYQMLSPDDVHVSVGRRDSGSVYVEGTAEEIHTIQRFADMVARYEHLITEQQEEAMSRVRQRFDRTESYRLPRSNRDALLKLLAAPDVPVSVSPAGAAIRIQATGDDQEIIREVVEILHGQ